MAVMKSRFFERIFFHALWFSLLVHIFALSYIFEVTNFLDQLKPWQAVNFPSSQEKKILLRLEDVDERRTVDSPFVSDRSKSHYGKKEDTPRGVNAFSQGDMGAKLPSDRSKTVQKGDQKKHPPHRDNTERTEGTSLAPQTVVTEDSFRYKLNISDDEGFSIGANQDMWAGFYLGIVRAIEASFSRFAANRFLLQSDNVEFNIEVGSSGKLYFKGFVTKSKSQPSINYVVEKSIEYAQFVNNIPHGIVEKYRGNNIPVLIRVEYSGTTGMWWISFFHGGEKRD